MRSFPCRGLVIESPALRCGRAFAIDAYSGEKLDAPIPPGEFDKWGLPIAAGFLEILETGPGTTRRAFSRNVIKIGSARYMPLRQVHRYPKNRFPQRLRYLAQRREAREGVLYQKAHEGYAHYLQPNLPCPPRLAHKEAVRYKAAAFEKREYRGMGGTHCRGIGSFYGVGTNPLALREPGKPALADRIGEAVLRFGSKTILFPQESPLRKRRFRRGLLLVEIIR